MNGMEEVLQFLKNAGTWYLATEEDGQPHVRPFGTQLIYKERLYFQTGLKKNVAKQMLNSCFLKQDCGRIDPAADVIMSAAGSFYAVNGFFPAFFLHGEWPVCRIFRPSDQSGG